MGVVERAQIIKACRAPGPLALSALSAEELELLEAMMRRLDRCAKAAFEARHPLVPHVAGCQALRALAPGQ